jgi:hypothetical protein
MRCQRNISTYPLKWWDTFLYFHKTKSVQKIVGFSALETLFSKSNKPITMAFVLWRSENTCLPLPCLQLDHKFCSLRLPSISSDQLLSIAFVYGVEIQFVWCVGSQDVLSGMSGWDSPSTVHQNNFLLVFKAAWGLFGRSCPSLHSIMEGKFDFSHGHDGQGGWRQVWGGGLQVL